MYRNFEELSAEAAKVGGLARAVLENEMELSGLPEEAVYEELARRWQVMRASAQKAQDAPQPMGGSLVTGTAQKQAVYSQTSGYTGALANRVMAAALSASEVNASMGRICAAPTAGACGVLPAVLDACAQQRGSSERQLLDALLVAGGVGALITRNATVSGAEGGCQAECGAAAAMAAAGAVVLAGGDLPTVGNAVSLALMNCMGLVCDPVAGLVQLPCAFRNASQAVNALLSADLALAGQDAVIPPDEAIEAMARVGRSLPEALRETAKGGVAASPTGKRIRNALRAQWEREDGANEDFVVSK